MSESENYDPDIKIRQLTAEIKEAVTSPVHIMAACSGYKVTMQKHHLHQLLPKQIHIHYGAGCPACLSTSAFIDKLLEYSKRSNVIIATYGDLLGVPGSKSTMEKFRTDGADIRVIHSIMDALILAKKNRRKRIIFPAVGFESAASSTAAAILQAKVAGVFNFHVLCDHKRMFSGMEAILQWKEVPVDGFITSGRVAASMGTGYFREFSERYHKPQAISGYESEDVLEAILHLVKQINNKTAMVENLFPSAVKAEGNLQSHQLLEEVFETDDAEWTGFGKIKGSGLKIKKAYRIHNAEEIFFDVKTSEPILPEGCLCSEIMRGAKVPVDCRHFAKTCSPINAIGACMYSEEGPCRVDFLFGR